MEPIRSATKPSVTEGIVPKGISIADEGNALVITRRFYNDLTIKSIIFCLLWNGLLFGCHRLFFDIHSSFVDQLIAVGPFALGLLLFLFVGVWTTYSALCGLINRTEIRVTTDALSIRHYPLPWSGNVQVRVATIDQLFCEEIEGGNSVIYNVGVKLKNGQQVRLLYRFLHKAQAAFIEQQVEQRLGIPDHPVAGEASKPDAPPTPRAVPRSKSAQPEDISVLSDGEGQVIIWRWNNQLGYTGIYTGMICAGIGTALVLTRPAFDIQSLMILVSAAVIAIPSLYFGLRGMLNRTIIRITDQMITVRHGPFPAGKSRCIAVKSINQLYCVDDRHTVGNENYSPVYSVWAVMADGERELLLAGINRLEQAEFIELEIEDQLGILDRPVIGEIIRDN